MNNGSNIKKPSLDDPNVPSFTKTMMDQKNQNQNSDNEYLYFSEWKQIQQNMSNDKKIVNPFHQNFNNIDQLTKDGQTKNNSRISSDGTSPAQNISRISSNGMSNAQNIENKNGIRFTSSPRITSGRISPAQNFTNSNIENQELSYSKDNINFDKIYTNKYDALSGNNSVSISDSTKKMWLDGEATFKTNEDGSVLISVNGVPYGWTTASVLNENFSRFTSNRTSPVQNYARSTSNGTSPSQNISRMSSNGISPVQNNDSNAMKDNQKYQNNSTMTSGTKENIDLTEKTEAQKSIGATFTTFGASVSEGAADITEKGVHGLAAMGAVAASPATFIYDKFTGNNTTKEMWNSVGDLMMETKVKDSWDSVYENEISDLKDKTYGFDKTRKAGNVAGNILVTSALTGGLDAASSAATSASTELSTSGTAAASEGTASAFSASAGSNASAAQNFARIEAASASGEAVNASSGIIGNSGATYSAARDVLSAVRKGDLDAGAAFKFVRASYNNIAEGGEIHTILAELGNLARGKL